jgi:uncharacterized protein
LAGSSLLVLIDDIANVLDDVATMTKVAAKKTAGVLGDDLALNAQQVAGVAADRELPIVWAVARGSLVNKAILVPAALAVSAVLPVLITPLLMIGGVFLCYEGVERLAHGFLHDAAEDAAHHETHLAALAESNADIVAHEMAKIRGAVRTDFILSAEIIVITLGTVADAPFAQRVAVLAGIALLMTVGVYGLVAGIVKLDDAGYHLQMRSGETLSARLQRRLGALMLAAAPRLMRALAVIGTLAMFLVGGGILVHGLPAIHDLLHHLTHGAEAIPAVGPVLEALTPTLFNGLVGVLAGALILGTISIGSGVWQRIRM